MPIRATNTHLEAAPLEESLEEEAELCGDLLEAKTKAENSILAVAESLDDLESVPFEEAEG